MSDFNKVVLSGRVSNIPKEISFSQKDGKNGLSVRFNLASNRKGFTYEERQDPNKVTSDFIPCVAFGPIAERLCGMPRKDQNGQPIQPVHPKMKKGDKISVIGKIQTGKYTNKDGQTIYTTDVYIEDYDLTPKTASPQQQAYAPAPQQTPQAAPYGMPPQAGYAPAPAAPQPQAYPAAPAQAPQAAPYGMPQPQGGQGGYAPAPAPIPQPYDAPYGAPQAGFVPADQIELPPDIESSFRS